MSEKVVISSNSHTNNNNNNNANNNNNKSNSDLVDNRNITFQPKLLNEYFTCNLCHGYFRTPMTIVECLHTFCKSCIFKYIARSTGIRPGCPTCKVSLGPRPYEAFKEDRVLEELITKIYPEVFEKDKKDEQEFYAKLGK